MDGDKCLSVIPLSRSLLCKGAFSHMDTLPLALTYMKSTHNYTVSCSQVQGNLSAGLFSAGSASPLSVQPLLPWRGEASSFEVLSAPI